MYYIDNFKKQTEPLYYLKDKEYLEKIKCHLQIVSSLFVNKGILIYLTSDNYSELINRTLYLKRIIRKNMDSQNLEIFMFELMIITII